MDKLAGHSAQPTAAPKMNRANWIIFPVRNNVGTVVGVAAAVIVVAVALLVGLSFEFRLLHPLYDPRKTKPM